MVNYPKRRRRGSNAALPPTRKGQDERPGDTAPTTLRTAATAPSAGTAPAVRSGCLAQLWSWIC